MTAKRDLKKLIRERMKKTGESYSSARRALSTEPPSAANAEPPPVAHSTQLVHDDIQGWIATGQAPDDYDFKIDKTGHHSASSALVRARTEKPGGFGTLTQRFSPDEYRGRRVRLSGSIKSEGVTGACKLWMRVELPGNRVIAFGQSPLITGTTDWARYDVVLDVDDHAAVLAFGILLEGGAGATWLSDGALDLVSDEVPTSNHLNEDLPHHPRNLDFNEPSVAVSQAQELCERLLLDSNALSVLLVDQDGDELAMAGDGALLDTTSVRSLCSNTGKSVVDRVAELAQQGPHGEQPRVHAAQVAQRFVLAVLFDMRSSLGLVRLRMKKASEELARILVVAPSGSGGPVPAAAPAGSSGSPAPAEIDDHDEPLH